MPCLAKWLSVCEERICSADLITVLNISVHWTQKSMAGCEFLLPGYNEALRQWLRNLLSSNETEGSTLLIKHELEIVSPPTPTLCPQYVF